MRQLLILFLLLPMQVVLAQSSSESRISSVFSAPAVSAYQTQSMNKISDFLNYLNILADPAQPEALKAEVKKTAVGLFNGSTRMLPGFLSNEPTTLQGLFDSVYNSGNIFSIDAFESFSNPKASYWLNTYRIKIANGPATTTRTVVQRVYFLPQIKQFGKTEKEVWTLLLGGKD